MDKLSRAIVSLEVHFADKDERLRNAWAVVHAKMELMLMPKWKYRCIMLWFYLRAWAHRIIGVVANGSQHREPKIDRVCETCADWESCPHTESWRIR